MGLAAVVLAAGQSTRMGRQKLLLPYKGHPVVRHIAETLVSAGIHRVIAVTGYDAEEVERALDGRSVQCARNPAPERGMFSSVQTGVNEAGEATGYLIALGDQPSIRQSVVQALAQAHASEPGHILTPRFEGRRGHPIVVPARYRDLVLSDRYEDTGLRGLLHEFPETVMDIDVTEDWILRDIDYPEDYRRELERLDTEP